MKTLSVTNPHCKMVSFLVAVTNPRGIKAGEVVKLERGLEIEYWVFKKESNKFLQIMGNEQVSLYKRLGSIV